MENSTGTDSTDSTSTPAEPGPADVSIPQLADVVLFKLLMTIDRDLEIGSWLDLGMFVQNVLIAAQARRRGLTLVTANVGEFERVPGLIVVNWTK